MIRTNALRMAAIGSTLLPFPAACAGRGTAGIDCNFHRPGLVAQINQTAIQADQEADLTMRPVVDSGGGADAAEPGVAADGRSGRFAPSTDRR
jgi:hypothetical protein